MGFLLVLVCVAGAIFGTGNASAEPSLEQRCIAAGLVSPLEFDGFTFNHHPEKDREVRATDNFLSPAEIDTSFDAVIAGLPEACNGRYSRKGLLKLQFKASRGGDRWRSLRKGWEEIHWSERYLPSGRRSYPEYLPYDGSVEYEDYSPIASQQSTNNPPLSPYVYFMTHQNTGSLGLGCAVASRARLKLEIVDDASRAIVAVRLIDLLIEIDSWAQARCQGKFSIQDSAAARRCGKRVVGGLPGGPPTIWGVKADRVSCSRASAVAQKALQVPAFSQGSLAAQEVDGWRCFFGFRGAAACLQGSKRVYLIAREGIREKCSGAPKGVKKLSVANTSCEVAAGLATQVLQDPSKELVGAQEAAGAIWSCAALRYFGSDDRMTNDYHCFSGEAMVSFELNDPKERIVPVEPTAIPPEVILPGKGPSALFSLTPELKFGESAKWTKKKVLLPIEVEAALVGQKARLELVTFKAECTWTSDESQDTPICPSTKRVGTSTRSTVLKPSQLVYFAPRKYRGNWIYRLTVKTEPFSYNGLAYRRTSHAATASMINEAANCDLNPWCHPKKNGR